jgi:hypothetical protein
MTLAEFVRSDELSSGAGVQNSTSRLLEALLPHCFRYIQRLDYFLSASSYEVRFIAPYT